MSRQVENSNYSMKTGEYVVQEKDKSALFSLQPYISWKLWAGLKERKKERKKKKPKQTKKNPELDLDWRTELRAALVCTHAKRRSLGRRLERKKKNIQGKKLLKSLYT